MGWSSNQDLGEPLLGLLEVVAHPEAGPVRTGVGDQTGPDKDGVLQCRDVREATQNLRVGGDELPVKVPHARAIVRGVRPAAVT